MLTWGFCFVSFKKRPPSSHNHVKRSADYWMFISCSSFCLCCFSLGHTSCQSHLLAEMNGGIQPKKFPYLHVTICYCHQLLSAVMTHSVLSHGSSWFLQFEWCYHCFTHFLYFTLPFSSNTYQQFRQQVVYQYYKRSSWILIGLSVFIIDALTYKQFFLQLHYRLCELLHTNALKYTT